MKKILLVAISVMTFFGCSLEPNPKVKLEAEPTVVQVKCINFGGVGKTGTVNGVRAKAYEVYYWSDGSKTFTPLPLPSLCP